MTLWIKDIGKTPMNPFEDLLNETIHILRKSGKNLGPFKVAFDGKTITLFDVSHEIEEGDFVTRSLPSGKLEKFQISEVTFHNRFEDIPAQYLISVRKANSTPDSENKRTTINISHSTGIQIGDNNQQIISFFHELIKEIEQSNFSESEKTNAKSVLKATITNPIIASIIGGAVPAILTLLK